MKKILGGLAVVLVGVVGFVMSQPNEWTVTRSIEISAPSEAVFNAVADFKGWSAWSPWFKRDPNMERTLSEPSAGLGARQDWKSKTEGSGYQITDVFEPPTKIGHQLVFTEPFADEGRDEWTFEAINDSTTRLTWSMKGANTGFVKKFFYTFMNLEKMIGNDFESGLGALKAGFLK
jgi:hypothetical protein